VLYPLRDIAPGWRHPLSGRAIDTLIQALPTSERLDIQKI
jgi:7,8-dihydro-6-hydroxymethylpterin-pyrophosphokinase